MQSPYGMKYYGNGSSMKTDVLPLLITKIIFVMSKKKNFVLETSQDHSGMKAWIFWNVQLNSPLPYFDTMIKYII